MPVHPFKDPKEGTLNKKKVFCAGCKEPLGKGEAVYYSGFRCLDCAKVQQERDQQYPIDWTYACRISDLIKADDPIKSNADLLTSVVSTYMSRMPDQYIHGKMEQVFRMLERARAHGQRIDYRYAMQAVDLDCTTNHLFCPDNWKVMRQAN